MRRRGTVSIINPSSPTHGDGILAVERDVLAAQSGSSTHGTRSIEDSDDVYRGRR